jgi:hypothetical protein
MIVGRLAQTGSCGDCVLRLMPLSAKTIHFHDPSQDISDTPSPEFAPAV